MNPLRKSFAALVLTGSAVAAGFFGYGLLQDVQFARAEQKVESTREQLKGVEDLASVFREVGKAIGPTVVNIEVRKSIRGAGRPLDDDLLRRFFPDRDGDGQPDLPPGFKDNEDGDAEQVGTGSGVIVEAAEGVGYIVTNNHVAGGATDMTITLADGRQITDAKVLGTDPKSDLAVIKIQADKLIPAQWGNSDDLQKGDWIMAFGSPFGYVGSMTHGIVSALHRDVGILRTQMGYENFIQVDAPINPGNSGGPLVDIRGNVVGINTAIASRSGGFQGIGFAIPSNQAKTIYEQLKSKGRVTRGWLGVSIGDVSDPQLQSVAKSFGYTDSTGVLVKETFPNTPAAGKFQPGDIITKMQGQDVKNVQQLRSAVAGTLPGTQVPFTIFRDKKEQDVTIKIGDQPDNMLAAANEHGGGAAAADQSAVEAFGLKVTTLTDELAQKFDLGDVKTGALITDVARHSPAEKAGLSPGDLITRVDNTPVQSAQDAISAIQKTDAAKGVRLYITTKQGSTFVFLKK